MSSELKDRSGDGGSTSSMRRNRNSASISNPNSLDIEWQGWAEIESDPAFFNVMLRELGVRGVCTREIFSLDDEMLSYLPRPVYGVIFLFRWKNDDIRADARYKAGSNVWFANQTVSNACASYALLNIVNNIPDVRLGPQLENFRHFTRAFSPALRGEALANFTFVKQIHNSFSRNMDRLCADVFMKSQAQSSQRSTKKRKRGEDETEPAHHFIAFVPIDGIIWKMDGLEWQPKSVGRVHCDDWLEQVKCDLESRMSQCEEGEIDFALLALAKNPYSSNVAKLAANVKSLLYLNDSPIAQETNLRDKAQDDNVLMGPDASYGLNELELSSACVHENVLVAGSQNDPHEAKNLIDELMREQKTIKASIKENQLSESTDLSKAERRRHDCSDAVHRWLHMLTRKKMLERVIAATL